MNSKAIVDLGSTEWIIATLVILFSLYLYATQSAETQQIHFEYSEQDTQQMIHERELFTLLHTPLIVSGKRLTFAEFFSYQEIDPHYENQLNNALARYAPDFHILLISGTQTIYEYGTLTLNAKTTRYEAQIPSLIHKKLVVALEKERVT
ncbi:MAG TPA: hypothetical protein VJG90_02160 [Candidatus Nanoarchaeia archaeon]|nr:hypothetical protein [Candidatus Nanoarchaeia archaeon]